MFLEAVHNLGYILPNISPLCFFCRGCYRVSRGLAALSGKILTWPGCRNNSTVSFLIAAVLFLATAVPAHAEITLTGKVTKIIDGDSVLVLQRGLYHEVRLWGIDCPEYDQPYAVAAGKLVKTLLRGKIVTVKVKNRDMYGREVGVIHRGTLNVNEELIRQGAAWVYGRYCRESICREWKKLETRARSEQQGLWSGKNVIAPWKWRRSKK